MNAHVANTLYGLQPQVAGPRYIEHHFGWWSLGCLVLMFVLMACAETVRGRISPSSGKGVKKSFQQLVIFLSSGVVGILYWAAAFAGFASICYFVAWMVAMRHRPGLM